MSLEETRRYHEERERIIDCFTKEIEFGARKTNSNKDKINSEHRKYILLERYLEVTERLKINYEDKLGMRQQEIQKMSSPNEFSEFYDRLTDITNYHRRNPNEIVEPISAEYDKYAKLYDNVEESSRAIVFFTDEEGYGKFLDLHDCYQVYVNLKGVKIVDYVTYLNTFDKLYEFPKEKKTIAYYNYLKQLFEYLNDFIDRAKPMFYITNSEERNEVEKDFIKLWEEGKFKGWPKEMGSAISSQSNAYLDLSPFNSPEELASLGLDRLKSALLALNLKCGGTLDERAKRLWSTKGVNNEALLEMQNLLKKGAFKGTLSKDDLNKDIAFTEARIYYLMDVLKSERIETIENVQRKQARTQNELEDEEESEDDNEIPDETEDVDQNSMIYNPKNLPLDWDNKPIPYWLYKLHGLNIYYTCEICGNEIYRGPKAFQQHFSEWKHAHGMRCLNIPNTAQFLNVTKISEAINLWNKINATKKELHHRIEEEEFEDSMGNVITKPVFEDLKRQGIL